MERCELALGVPGEQLLHLLHTSYATDVILVNGAAAAAAAAAAAVVVVVVAVVVVTFVSMSALRNVSNSRFIC